MVLSSNRLTLQLWFPLDAWFVRSIRYTHAKLTHSPDMVLSKPMILSTSWVRSSLSGHSRFLVRSWTLIHSSRLECLILGGSFLLLGPLALDDSFLTHGALANSDSFGSFGALADADSFLTYGALAFKMTRSGFLVRSLPVTHSGFLVLSADVIHSTDLEHSSHMNHSRVWYSRAG